MAFIEEHGLAEALTAIENDLQQRMKAVANAWEGAAVTEQSDLIDAVAAQAPRRSGELAGSGFVNRETGEAGFGSDHAWQIGEQFDEAVDQRAAGVADRMAARLEGFAEAGITKETAPSNWPEAPVTHARAGRSRRRDSERVNAGAKRGFK